MASTSELDALLRSVRWRERWELAPGILSPGRIDVAALYAACGVPERLDGCRCLVIGDWNGCFAFEAERRSASATLTVQGADPDVTGFERIRTALGSSVRPVKASLYGLDTEALGSFDVVLVFDVLARLRHPLLALDEIRRVCRGRLFVQGVPLAETGPARLEEATALARLVETAGFAVERASASDRGFCLAARAPTGRGTPRAAASTLNVSDGEIEEIVRAVSSPGSAARETSTRAALLHPGLSARDFLENAYRVLLRRPPDAAGLANFLGQEGTITREHVLEIIMESAEFRNLFLADPHVAGLVGRKARELAPVSASAERLSLELVPLTLPIRGRVFTIYDYPGFVASSLVAAELAQDAYRIADLTLPASPVIVDVGANLGLFSLTCLDRWPDARVLAFEPVPTTFAMLDANLRANGLSAEIEQAGLSGDGRTLTIQYDPWGNAAAASAVYSKPLALHAQVTAPTRRLEDVLDERGIATIDLLKIDCEGLEYEILDMPRLAERVRHLRVEVHSSATLAAQGRTPERLIARLEREFGPERLHVVRADKDSEEKAARDRAAGFS